MRGRHLVGYLEFHFESLDSYEIYMATPLGDVAQMEKYMSPRVKREMAAVRKLRLKGRLSFARWADFSVSALFSPKFVDLYPTNYAASLTS